MTIAIAGVNDAPTANPQTVTTHAGTPVAIALTGGDVDGDPLSFSVASAPLHGTLSGVAPALTYTPDPGFAGEDSFTFTASDGVASSPAATVAINVAGGLGGKMTGGGFIDQESGRHHFTLMAVESDSAAERGSFTYHLQRARGRDDRFQSAAIDSVTFSSSGTAGLRGTGVWNGTAGYSIEATAADAGEPGHNDTIAIVIKSPTGQVAASVSGRLSGGNIQAHQP